MNINIKGQGNIVIPHRSTMPKAQWEKVREDTKALLLRPATFRNHSGIMNPA